MGHDISMVDENGCVIEIDAHHDCGNYLIVDGEGTTEARIGITYNYSWFYYKFIDSKKGIKWIYGKKGSECVERLKNFIKELEIPRCFGSAQKEISPNEDYWSPTPTNACMPIRTLLEWAERFPDGVFDGDGIR